MANNLSAYYGQPTQATAPLPTYVQAPIQPKINYGRLAQTNAIQFNNGRKFRISVNGKRG